MRYTQSNTKVSNSQTISDGVILDGTNIELTNTGSGRIVGGLQFAQAGNTLINETGAVVRGADNAPATAVSVTGSTGADTIINSGTIIGAIALGAGSDTFVQRNGARPDLDLGVDNDLLRFEGGGSNFAANGGAGYDTVVLASGFSGTYGTDIVGFERLVVESDIVVNDYSGYQAIEFTNPGRTIHVGDSQNPLVDLRLAGQGVDLYDYSTLRSITGGNASEAVGLSAGAVVSGLISLGAGSDQFDLFYRPDFPDARFARVDGGDGFDRMQIGVRGVINRQLDYSGISNFDQLDIYTQDAPSTVTLAGLNGFRRIDLRGPINLTLADSALSGAVFTISLAPGETSAPQGITLASGTVIGSFIGEAYQDAQSEYPTEGAASATLLVNSGRIEGDVRFNKGDDRYDGRSGTVGGTVYGNAGNDVLLGGSGSDVLFGGEGNDTLAGGAGTNRMTGGVGADTFLGTRAGLAGDTITDLAVGDRIVASDLAYANANPTRIGAMLSLGNGASVTIAGAASTRLVVNAAGEGGTEIAAVNRYTGLSDFNGDGHSDLLWREASGDFSTWNVSGNADGNQLAKNSTYVDGVGTNWTIAETFDFNGDGRSDILWREQNAGQFTIWNGQGSSWAQNSYSNNTVSSDWTIAGVGDLNGDGRDDIVWRQDGGDFSTWQSTGTGFNTNVTYDSSVAPDWQIVGLADFNGDNKDDLLWRNQGSGAFSIWSSTGDGFTPNTYYDAGVDTSWHIDGLADFNGDGKDDILWRHDDDGALTTWQSTGSGFNLNVYDDKSVNPVWQVANTGDFNNDGKADLMFRNVADGTFTTWESNGNGFDPNVVSDSSVGTNWQIQAHDLQFG